MYYITHAVLSSVKIFAGKRLSIYSDNDKIHFKQCLLEVSLLEGDYAFFEHFSCKRTPQLF